MPLAALLLLASGAAPTPALALAFAGDLQLTLAADPDGPPPGSAYPPPPPLVQDPSVPPAPPPIVLSPESYPPPLPPPAPPAFPPPLPPPAPLGDVGVRLLWGAGLQLGGAEDQFSEVAASGAGGSQSVGDSSGAAGVGAYLRVGAQVNDRWGTEAELSAGTLILDAYLRTAITADLTPVDWFTFAFGPIVREDAVFICSTTTAESVGGTLRFDFHIGPSRTPSGRSAFTVGLQTDLGATVGGSEVSGPGLAYGFYLTAGYAHY